jgi:cysteinyl-tRNA synthetase
MNSAGLIAMKDISEYISELNEEKYTYYSIDNKVYCDVWVAFGNYVYTKENRNLNRKLGLHKINKKWKQ